MASIDDPLGFVAPFILVGKQILQQMYQDKVGWDEPLSEELKPRLEFWLLDLKNLASTKIQRCYLPEGFEKVERYELHFSDASVKGYGECSYLRAISVSNQVHCSLVIGKAKVTPTKVTTVPWLELSAAVRVTCLKGSWKFKPKNSSGRIRRLFLDTSTTMLEGFTYLWQITFSVSKMVPIQTNGEICDF